MTGNGITLCSGPVFVRIRGVNESELQFFFSPFFEVRKCKPQDPLGYEINVLRLESKEWWVRRRQLPPQTHFRPVVLHRSKKPAHHIEGLGTRFGKSATNYILFDDAWLEIQARERRIVFVVREHAAIQAELRALTRNIMKRQWEYLGGIMIHAAAVGVGKETVLLVGAKGSGKTNLLLHFVREGAEIISFDRVILDRKNGNIRVYGWPTYFNVDPLTLARYADLLPDSGSMDLAPTGGKVSMIASEVSHLSLKGEGQWSRTIFPRFKAGFAVNRMSCPSPDECYRTLLQECLSPDPPGWNNCDVFCEFYPEEVHANARRLLRDMAASGKCVRWQFSEIENSNT